MRYIKRRANSPLSAANDSVKNSAFNRLHQPANRGFRKHEPVSLTAQYGDNKLPLWATLTVKTEKELTFPGQALSDNVAA